MTPLLRPLRCLLPSLAAALLLAAVAGCATAPPRAAAIDRHASAYIYHHPKDDVIAALQRMLEDRGFEVMPVMQGNAVKTEWRGLIGSDQVGTVQERYVIIVYPLTKQHSRITAMRLQRSTMGMEAWHPLSRVDSDPTGKNGNNASPTEGLVPLPMGKPLAKRALDIEWELIRRLDPVRARQIEAMVDYRLTQAP